MTGFMKARTKTTKARRLEVPTNCGPLLNVDLDVYSREPLDVIADALARKVSVNYIGRERRRVLVPPERHFSGPDLEAGTGVRRSHVDGVHLRMPGNGDEGPTLETFTYSRIAEGLSPAVNRPGFGHIAFAVDSIVDARTEVLVRVERPSARS